MIVVRVLPRNVKSHSTLTILQRMMVILRLQTGPNSMHHKTSLRCPMICMKLLNTRKSALMVKSTQCGTYVLRVQTTTCT
ncbi:hypothetical protein FR483_n812R [Paramecium bursaria Chlorella virus FR483]|uniref:Uncharacterized protein n812R n=1 Tax=Paramecium bursaria Chlorella virus FR483 TaxID=399781 RepID=A7J8G6_PBCVF|nr:hypothetical protein FR483_n812R [Paramecium bursaria Chlorella virus FR483]ABT16097.1 hypothetical protein FR483_n812R [Paramecium bursaria Chlorella virus FR483]